MKNYLEHIKNFDGNIINIIIFSFVFNFANSIFGVIYNLYLLQINFNDASIGNVISGGSLGIIIFSMIAIILSSKIGYKRHLAVSIISAVSLNLMKIYIISPIYLYWINFLASGIMFSMSVVVYPIIIGTAKKESLTYAFGLNFFASWIALTLGNLAGGYLPNIVLMFTSSIIDAYRITLISGTLLLLAALIPVSKIKMGEKHEAQYLNIKKLSSILNDKKDLKLMIEYFTIAFIIGLAAGLFVPFFNVILKNKFNMNSATIGIIMAVSQAITAFGGFAGPLIAEKIGRVNTVVLLNLLSLPFLMIMGFANVTVIFLSAFFMRNAFMNMGEPISSGFILSSIKDDKKIILNSMVNVFFQLGWFIQAPIAGKLMLKYGYSFVFFIATGIYFIRAIVYYYFFKNEDETSKKIIKTS